MNYKKLLLSSLLLVSCTPETNETLTTPTENSSSTFTEFSSTSGNSSSSSGEVVTSSGNISLDETTFGQDCENCCGNGIVEENEECDDKNSFDNDGCNNNCFLDRYVFISYLKVNANFKNLNDLHIACQNEASQNDLSGKYKAWVANSDVNTWPSENPEFTEFTGLYYVPSFVPTYPVAKGWDELSSGILTSNIDHHADETIVEEELVWTGINPEGKGNNSSNCSNWSTIDNITIGIVGSTASTGPQWTAYDYLGDCDRGISRSFYCFQVGQ
jgi:cysteine-rich repeat protein